MSSHHAFAAASARGRLAGFLSDYGPAFGLFLTGFPIAFDYGRTGRIDLLLGGMLVSLLGIVIADHISGHDVFASLVRRGFKGMASIEGRTLVALTGLATAFTLCLGEAAALVARHDIGLADCLAPCVIGDVAQDPSALKIAATALLFPAASLMNFPAVHGRIAPRLSALHIKCLQNVLSGSGSIFIGLFGVFMHAFSAMAFGALCGAAHLIALGIRAHALRRARLINASA